MSTILLCKEYVPMWIIKCMCVICVCICIHIYIMYMYMHKILKYHILLIIHSEKFSLFSIFTIIPWEKVCSYQLLQTFQAFACKNSLKKLMQLQINRWKMQKFFITNIKQYRLLLYSCTYVAYSTKLLWQITLVFTTNPPNFICQLYLA